MLRRDLLVLVLACAAGATRAEERACAPLAPEMAAIRSRGTLLIATAAFDVPPFVAAGADGALKGRDVELGRGLASALGVGVQFRRFGSVDEIIDATAQGVVDLALAGLRRTLQRAQRVRFSRPYAVLQEALLVNRPRFAALGEGRDPLTAVNAPDAVVGLLAGDAADAARLLPRAQLRRYPRWQPELVDAVLSGEVLAAFGAAAETQAALAASPDAPLRLRRLVLPESRIAIAGALPWASLQLLAWVDLYLETAAATGAAANGDDNTGR